MIILGIVPASEVPPTVEKVEEGLLVRFFKHNPKLLRCKTASLKKKVESGEGVSEDDKLDFTLRVLKKTVVIDLKAHVSGHGQVRLNKVKFLALLDF